MKLLDTNVIVYAIGRTDRYKKHCARLLQDVADGDRRYVVDTDLLQEILHLYSARGQRRLGLSTCASLLLMFPNPLPVTRDEIVVAHELMTKHDDLVPRDAIHAAVTRTNDLEGIVSADRVFDGLGGIRRFDPLTLYPDQE
ncbi:MAG: type II toxin-antitoxin system VapC family toxin [Chloroflexi bacterium]|nr:type II toxin-antitoxin system VapC family toxin [Chloroflexota bacterium]